MSEETGSRLLMVSRVAAASALGSLAAVITIGYGLQQQILFPWVVNAVVVLVAVICVVAVVMISSDQGKSSASTGTGGANRTETQLAPEGQIAQGGQHGTRSQPDPGTHRDPRTQHGPQPPLSPESPGHLVGERGFTLTGGPTAGGTTGGLAWHEAAKRGVAGAASGPMPPPTSSPLPAAPGQEAIQGRPSPPEQQEIWMARVDPDQAVRRVVQCPRCGSFGVRAVQVRDGCAFECQDCGHPWDWQPGTPWPLTVIRPRLRRLNQSPPAAAPAVWRLPS